MADATATLTLRLRDLASAGFRGAAKVGKSALDDIRESGEKAKKAFDFAGKLAFAASGLQQASAQLRGITRGPVDEFKAFDFQMTKVGIKTRDLAEGEFEQLRQAARRLGKETFFTALEAGEGLEELAKAGLSAKEQMAAILPVMRLAQSGQTDLGRSAQITANIMEAWGFTADQIGDIGNTLAGSFDGTTVTLDQMFEGLKLVNLNAKRAGLTFKDTAKFVAILSGAGLQGSLSGTAFRGILAGLQDPAKGAEKTLRKMGLSVKFLTDNMKDPGKVVAKFAEEMKDLSQFERERRLFQIFGRRQAGPFGALIDALIDTDNARGGLNDRLEESIEKARRLNKIQRDGLVIEGSAEGQTKKLRSQIDELRLSIGEKMLPVELKFMEMTKDVTQTLSDFADENPRTAGALAKSTFALGGFLALSSGLLFAVQNMITLGAMMRVVPIAAWAVSATRSLDVLFFSLSNIKGVLPKVTGRLGQLSMVAGAGFAGVQIGKLLDSWIGQLFDMRDGLVSSQLALELGLSPAFNQFIEDTGAVFKAFGAEETGQFLQEVAAGNRLRNQQRLEDEAEASTLREGAPRLGVGATPAGRGAPGRVGAQSVKALKVEPIKGQIDINVTTRQAGAPASVAVRAQGEGQVKLNVGRVVDTP